MKQKENELKNIEQAKKKDYKIIQMLNQDKVKTKLLKITWFFIIYKKQKEPT